MFHEIVAYNFLAMFWYQGMLASKCSKSMILKLKKKNRCYKTKQTLPSSDHPVLFSLLAQLKGDTYTH